MSSLPAWVYLLLATAVAGLAWHDRRIGRKKPAIWFLVFGVGFLSFAVERYGRIGIPNAR